MSEQDKGKLELIATQKVKSNSDLYKVIDFLNRNLKSHNLMFGLTKHDELMTISVYEVE